MALEDNIVQYEKNLIKVKKIEEGKAEYPDIYIRPGENVDLKQFTQPIKNYNIEDNDIIITFEDGQVLRFVSMALVGLENPELTIYLADEEVKFQDLVTALEPVSKVNENAIFTDKNVIVKQNIVVSEKESEVVDTAGAKENEETLVEEMPEMKTADLSSQGDTFAVETEEQIDTNDWSTPPPYFKTTIVEDFSSNDLSKATAQTEGVKPRLEFEIDFIHVYQDKIENIKDMFIMGGGGTTYQNAYPSEAPLAEQIKQTEQEVLKYDYVYETDFNTATIIADHPELFTEDIVTRIIEITPTQPPAFNLTEFVITGLPEGVTILNAEQTEPGVWTILKPDSKLIEAAEENGHEVKTPYDENLDGFYENIDNGTIEIIFSYPRDMKDTFEMNVYGKTVYNSELVTDELREAGFQEPVETELEFDKWYGVQIKEVNEDNLNSYLFEPFDGEEAYYEAGFVLSTNLNDNEIYGTRGDNDITGSLASDYIVTQHGDDTIRSGADDDYIIAGAGDDYIDGGTNNTEYDYGKVWTYGGDNDMIGDTISFENFIVNKYYPNDGVEVNLDKNYSLGEGTDEIYNIENIIGSDYKDNLTGNQSNNIILAGAYSDIIFGLGGNDELYGEDGNDIIAGGAGDDFIYGGSGDDTVSFENATNGIEVRLQTEEATELGKLEGMSWGEGTDYIYEVENIIGSNYNDLISGNSGNNEINGLDGIDTIDYSHVKTASVTVDLERGYALGDGVDLLSNIENIIGTNNILGDDTLIGNDVSNVIEGLKGNDVIKVNAGDDFAYGGEGNDTIYAGEGNDYLDGGLDNDTIDFSEAETAINVSIRNENPQDTNQGIDTILNFENVVGSSFNDVIEGNYTKNIIDGGVGEDLIDYEFYQSGIEINLSNEAVLTNTQILEAGNVAKGNFYDELTRVENVNATNFDDFIVGSAFSNKIYANGGDDYITSDNSNYIDGGSGDDTLDYSNSSVKVIAENIKDEELYEVIKELETDELKSIEHFIGSNYNDILFVNDSATKDYIFEMGEGKDEVKGGSGDDRIYAEQGDDIIYGSEGRDTINGGEGNDTLNYSQRTEDLEVNLSMEKGTLTIDNLVKDRFENVENVITGTGNDTVIGGEVGNIIETGAGDDTIFENFGSNSVDGGEGNDTLDYSYLEDAKIDININTEISQVIYNDGNNEIQTKVKNIENVIGTNYNDTITTNNKDNIINSSEGDDYIVLFEGNDTIDGGVNGLEDKGDTVDFSNIDNAITLDLTEQDNSQNTGAGNKLIRNVENVVATNYDDYIIDNGENNVYKGLDGSDTVDFSETNKETYINISNQDFTNKEGKTLYKEEAAIESERNVLESIENIEGSKGNDYIVTSEKDNTINSGLGNDTIYSSKGNDIIDGGEDSDTVSYEKNEEAISIEGLKTSGTVVDKNIFLEKENIYLTDTIYNIENVVGSAYNDVITGSNLVSEDNIIDGYEGNDYINGGMGNDTLKGGDGDDIIEDTLGNNKIYGGEGSDTLDYSNNTLGIDLVQNSIGNHSTVYEIQSITIDGVLNVTEKDLIKEIENIIGTNEIDRIYTNEGNNKIYGGAGNDILFGGYGTNEIEGGIGSDTLDYSSLDGKISLNLALENQQTVFDNGTDYIVDKIKEIENVIATNYDDEIIGSTDNNIIKTLEGDDTLKVGTGDDYIDLGSNSDFSEENDTLSFENISQAIKVDLSNEITTQDTLIGNKLIKNVENVIGTNFDDYIKVNNSDNNIIDGGGDNLNGDTIDYSDSTSNVRINIGLVDYSKITLEEIISIDNSSANNILKEDTLKGIENIVGSNYNDYIVTSATDNKIESGEGDDIIISSKGNDYIDGGTNTISGNTENDTISYELNQNSINVVGYKSTGAIVAKSGTLNDELINIENITGSSFNDHIEGDENTIEKNIIHGGNGNDYINGGAGDDILYGDNGDDTIEDNFGNNTIIGGEGSDTIDYSEMTQGISLYMNNQELTSTVKIIETDESLTEKDTIETVENFIGSEYSDVIYTNEANNTIESGAGDDIIFEGYGNNVVDGGTDSVTDGDTTNDTPMINVTDITNQIEEVVEGRGDTLDYRSLTNGTLNVDLASTQVQSIYTDKNDSNLTVSTKIKNVENVIGTNDSDIIKGNNENNIIFGGDEVAGKGDTIDGRAGNNTIFGGEGDDTILAGDGDNYIEDKSGTNTITLGHGDNTVVVEGGDNTITTGNGNDTINAQNNTFGDDISTGNGVDIINAGSGNDVIEDGMGNDFVYGNAGQDTIIISDSYNLSDDSTQFDTIDGGSQDTDSIGDIISFINYGTDITVDIGTEEAQLVGEPGYKKIIDIEGVIGGTGNDYITGNQVSNYIDGGADGVDTVDYSFLNGKPVGFEFGVFVNLSDEDYTLKQNNTEKIILANTGYKQEVLDTLLNIENVVGTEYDDLIKGNISINNIQTNEGNDRIIATTGSDIIDGGTDNDTIDYSLLEESINISDYDTQSIDNTVIKGQYSGTDKISKIENIIATNYDDNIDILSTDNEINIISTLSGNDTVQSGGGDDIVDLGEGNDTFIFSEGNNEINGGDDTDTLDYSSVTDDISISLIDDGGETDTYIDNIQKDKITAFENIKTGSGDDDIVGNNLKNTIETGSGDDTISVKYGVGNYVDGGTDTLTQNINTTLTGVANNPVNVNELYGDTYSFLNIPSYNTKLDLSNTLTQNTIEFDGQLLSSMKIINVENIIGSSQNDNYIGSVQNNTIKGMSGDDYIQGKEGSDILFGGDENTILDDINLATDGQDTLDGGAGDDFLYGGTDRDILRGGAGDDYLNGGAGVDTADYTEATEDLTIDLSQQGPVFISNSQGTDTFVSIEGAIGGKGNDEIRGTEGANVLKGSEGDDKLFGNGGDDVLDGGTGVDFVSFNFTSDNTYYNMDVTLDLANTEAQDTGAGTVTLQNIENVEGGIGNDTLYGNAFANTMEGGEGSDILYGSAGKDILNGSGAEYTLQGVLNTNIDKVGDINTLSYIRATNGIQINMNNEDDNDGIDETTDYKVQNDGFGYKDIILNFDIIRGSNNDDLYISGSNILDTFYGGDGQDTIVVSEGQDQLFGGEDGDIFNILSTVVTNSTIYGDLAPNTEMDSTLDNGEGDEVNLSTLNNGFIVELKDDNEIGVIKTNDGQNTELVNMNSIENVVGSMGDDIISGNSKRNILEGGAGDDTFYVSIGGDDIIGGTDTLTDSDLTNNTQTSGDTMDVTSLTNGINLDLLNILNQNNMFDILPDGQETGEVGELGAYVAEIENVLGTDSADIFQLGQGIQKVIGTTNDNLKSTSQDTITYEDYQYAVNVDLSIQNNYQTVADMIFGGTVVLDQHYIDGVNNLIGTAGADTLTGNANVNIIRGGANDDIINGGAGGDFLFGETGNDTFEYDEGTDTIDGGSDTSGDTIDYSNYEDNTIIGTDTGYDMIFSLYDGEVNINSEIDMLVKNDEGLSTVENIIATKYDDTIYLDSNNNVVDGGEGINTLNYSKVVNTNGSLLGVEVDLTKQGIIQSTNQGDDTISNIQNIIGSIYNDRLTTNEEQNEINSGAGQDTIILSDGNDTINSGEGNDTIIYNGHTEVNQIDGGLQDDILTEQSVTGDTIDYKAANNSIKLTLDNDNYNSVYISDSQDTITNTSNLTELDQIRNIENVIGGSGNDTFMFSEDYYTEDINNIIDGFEGVDTIDYSNQTKGVEIYLIEEEGKIEISTDIYDIDTLLNIENIVGTSYNDILEGNGGENIIDGGAQTAGGADILTFEHYQTGVEFDFSKVDTGLSQDVNSSEVFTDLYTVYNIEDLRTTEYNDIVYGRTDNQSAQIELLEGNDTYVATSTDGQNVINGGTENIIGGDKVDYSSITQQIVGTLNTLPNGAIFTVNGVQDDTLIEIENLDLGTASDTVTGSSESNIINGNLGNDTINGGAGDDFLNGEEGNDTLIGGLGVDYMNGGTNSDGSIENDTADYKLRTEGILVDMSVQNEAGFKEVKILGNTEDYLINIENIDGSLGEDEIIGDSGNNYIYGYSQADKLKGGLGDDYLIGGDGNDIIYFDSILNGTDVINGGEESDSNGTTTGENNTLSFENIATGTVNVDISNNVNTSGDYMGYITMTLGQEVNGTMVYEDNYVANIQTIKGTNTEGYGIGDIIKGDAEDNTILGLAGDDNLDGGLGDDTINGGSGFDMVNYETRGYIISADLQTSQIIVGDVNAPEESDNIIDVEGIKTGTNDDIIKTANDQKINLIDGHTDTAGDTIDYSNYNLVGVKINLGIKDFQKVTVGDYINYVDGNPIIDLSQEIPLTSVTREGLVGDWDKIINVEKVIGTAGADILIGDNNNNELNGEDGEDFLFTSDGSDTLNGGVGKDTFFVMKDSVDIDTINGGSEYDTINFSDYSEETDSVNINLNEGQEIQATSSKVVDGNQIDLITKVFNVENVIGTAGDDTISGDLLSNTLMGESGNDTIKGESGNDIIYGGEGDDNLYGDEGTDTLYGGEGNDKLNGGIGDNILYGESGDDILYYKGGNGDIFDGGTDSKTLGLVVDQTAYDQINWLVGDTINFVENEWGVELNLADSDFQNIRPNGAETKIKLINIENVEGSTYDDRFYSDVNTSNYIDGGSGNETIGDTVDYSNLTVNDITKQYLNATAIDNINIVVDIDGNGNEVFATDAQGNIVSDTLLNIENIKGTAGNDKLSFSTANWGMTIEGGAGDDTIEGGLYDDVINGGTESTYGDTVSYAKTDSSVNVNLTTGVGRVSLDNEDTLIEIENAVGTRYSDTFVGNSDDNKFDGYDYDTNGNPTSVADTIDYSDQNISYNLDTNAGKGINADLTAGIITDWDPTNVIGTDTVIDIENITGTNKDDQMKGDENDNTFIGGYGNDNFLVTEGTDTFEGGEGQDRIDFSDLMDKSVDITLGGDTTVYDVDAQGNKIVNNNYEIITNSIEDAKGTILNDTIVGNNLNNKLYGNDGNDILDGKTGNDYVNGGLGDDTIYGGMGVDVIDGGVEYTDNNSNGIYDLGDTLIDQGNDTLTYANVAGSIELDLDSTKMSVNGAGIDTDTFDNIENFIGSKQNDTFISGENKGNDYSINMNEGEDTYTLTTKATTDNEKVEGGAGVDTFVIIDSVNDLNGKEKYLIGDNDINSNILNNDIINATTVTTDINYLMDTIDNYSELIINNSTNTNSYTLNIKQVEDFNSGSGNDTIDGNEVNNKIYGNDGNDIISGGNGIDYLDGGTNTDGSVENDTISYQYLTTKGVDLDLKLGFALIEANADEDTLLNFENILGSNQTDTLKGNDGDNKIEGGEGIDTIIGTLGDDTIYGSFEVNPTNENDILTYEELDEVSYYVTSDGLEEIQIRDVSNTDMNTNTLYTQNIYNIETFKGTKGNDIIYGSAIADIIYGLEGLDELSGGAGADTIYGGAGADTFSFKDDATTEINNIENDLLDGGTESDTINFSIFTDNYDLTLDLNDGNIVEGDISGTTFEVVNVENIVGTKGINIISGDNSNNILEGAGKDDILKGENGADTLKGMAGSDDLQGGSGDDTIYGGEGNDDIDGGANNDTINGDEGNDTIYGNTGLDTINGGSGDDTIYGGEGNDTIYGNEDNDTINGGSGDDVIDGGFTDNNNDNINDEINTLTFSTALIGQTIDMNTKYNLNIIDGTFTENINGEYFKTTADDIVDQGTDYVKNIRDIIGSGQVDVITTDNQDNYIQAGGEADIINVTTGTNTIVGQSGNDIINVTTEINQTNYIYGGSGDDTIKGQSVGGNYVIGGEEADGSSGSDTIDYRALTSGLDVDLENTIGISTYTKENNEKVINTDGSVDPILDMVEIETNNITGATDYIMGIENIYATNENDTLKGNDFDNIFYGEGGDDFLVGRGGFDQLFGGSHNNGIGDTLSYEYMTLTDFEGYSVNVDLVNKTTMIKDNTNTETTDYDIFDGIEVFELGETNDNIINDMQSGMNQTINGMDGNDRVIVEDYKKAVFVDLNEQGGHFSYESTDLNSLGLIDDGLGNIIDNAVVKTILGAGIVSEYDTLISIEDFTASRYDDVIYTSAADNKINAYDGNDTVYLSAGTDYIDGGAGDDKFIHVGDTNIYGDNAVLNGIDYIDGEGSVLGDKIDYSNISNTYFIKADLSLFADSEGNIGETEDSVWNLIEFYETADENTVLTTATDYLKNIEGIIGTAGNDTLIGNDIANILQGGDGDDIIEGISSEVGTANILNGEGGNDKITGGTGKDEIDGGTEDDIVYGSAGNDIENGGEHTIEDGTQGTTSAMIGYGDTISYEKLEFAEGEEVGVMVSFETSIAVGTKIGSDIISGFENVIGTSVNDNISVDNGNNRVNAGAGDDIIQGGSSLVAVDTYDSGNDYINGGAGDDYIYTGLGDDIIDGGYTLVDDVDGDGVYDILDGDTINQGMDIVDYSRVSGLTSGIQVDLSSELQQDFGTLGQDTLLNLEGIVGTTATDWIIGTEDSNYIKGDNGADIIAAYSIVEDKSELYNYDPIAISTADVNGLNDYILNNPITATNKDNSGINNYIDGGAGNDYIMTVESGLTNNTIIGGDGTDTLNIQSNTKGVYIDLKDENGNNLVVNNLEYNGIENNFIVDHNWLLNNTGAQNGVLSIISAIENGPAEDDEIITSVFGIENVITGDGDDYIQGKISNKIITNGGNDTIYLLEGNNEVIAGTEDDYIYSGSGNDYIDGGSDTLGDTVDYVNYASGVYIDLRTTANGGNLDGNILTVKIGEDGATATDNDMIANIEIIKGTNVKDTFIMTDGIHNKIFGGSGDDVFFGDTTDYIEGGIGNDDITFTFDTSNSGAYIDGGSNGIASGNDTLNITNDDNTKELTIDLVNETADYSTKIHTVKNITNINTQGTIDTVITDGINQSFNLGAGIDKVVLTDVTASYSVDLGLDIATTTEGSITLSNVEDLTTSDGNDYIKTQSNERNVVSSGAGADTIEMYNISDDIDGEAGDDIIKLSYAQTEYLVITDENGTNKAITGTSLGATNGGGKFIDFKEIYDMQGDNQSINTNSDTDIDFTLLGGDDYLNITKGNNINVEMGTGWDTVRIESDFSSNSKDLYVNQVEVVDLKNTTFKMGAGDEIIISNSTTSYFDLYNENGLLGGSVSNGGTHKYLRFSDNIDFDRGQTVGTDFSGADFDYIYFNGSGTDRVNISSMMDEFSINNGERWIGGAGNDYWVMDSGDSIEYSHTLSYSSRMGSGTDYFLLKGAISSLNVYAKEVEHLYVTDTNFSYHVNTQSYWGSPTLHLQAGTKVSWTYYVGGTGYVTNTFTAGSGSGTWNGLKYDVDTTTQMSNTFGDAY